MMLKNKMFLYLRFLWKLHLRLYRRLFSDLKDTGWVNSLFYNIPLDKNNKAVPFWNYGVIKILQERLQTNFKVLEFGSGNSTIWLGEKVETIVSIERNKTWYEHINNIVCDNVYLLFGKSYYTVLKNNNIQVNHFDIIIIDGEYRNECAVFEKYLKETGVIIFDDTHREEYKNGKKYLNNLGYKNIDFWGYSQGDFLKVCTSIFYKTNNCLNI